MNTQNYFKSLSVIASMVLVLPASAAVITPFSASANTSINGTRVLTKTIDGSDLNDSDPDVMNWIHTGNNGADGYWLSNTTGPGNQVLTYGFDTAQDLSAMYIWNYSRSGEADRGIDTAVISFSTDGTIFNVIPTEAMDINTGGGGGTISTQVVTFSATKSNVLAVRIDTITNHGDSQYTGLAEVRFETAAVAPVPEPSSAALFGIAGFAWLVRRRR